ncbi:MAG: NADH-quinone oxidoreductase subunit NuoE [Pseudomonadota bacterium]
MLTEEIKREILEEIERCGSKLGCCIEALQIAQHRLGWISDECVRELALLLEMTPEELDGTATFYNRVYRRPVGRHVVLVCDSVSCWMLGYGKILEHLSSRLGIGLGETTKDGRFTLLPIQCLGACHQAPAIMIDEDLHGDLDPQKIDEILERYA